MKFKYAFNKYSEDMARTVARDLAISTRAALEVSDMIRGRNIESAIRELTLIKNLKKPLRYRKSNSVSHKPGVGPAKYPVSCATEFIKLLNQVQANAQFKGLNSSNLEIIHVNANQANRPFRYGRQRRIKAKRTHVEIVVAESKKKHQKQPLKQPKQQKSKIKIDKNEKQKIPVQKQLPNKDTQEKDKK